MTFDLSVITFIQYIAHVVSNVVHNFPAFMSYLQYAKECYVQLSYMLPQQLQSLSFFAISSCFLVRVVKF